MIETKSFGKLSSGNEANLVTMKNSNGVSVSITDYGAAIVSIVVPDRNGKFDDIVWGYDSVEGYERGTSYFGALCGRVANRIANAEFELNGTKYTLAANDGNNHLHGGVKGFDKVLWNTEVIQDDKNPSIKMTYLSVDGEEGYPGNVNVSIIYTLTEENELKLEYEATSDKDTLIALTSHSYFNLAGQKSDTCLNHKLKLNAKKITDVIEGAIPTGEFIDVIELPFDFTDFKSVGKEIDSENRILKLCNGYDQNWVIDDWNGKLKLAAELKEDTSGRILKLYTTEPGIQFYSGNYIAFSEEPGKNGKVYKKRSALCLEAQHFPDSIHHKNFPSVIVKAGEKYSQTTIHKFETM